MGNDRICRVATLSAWTCVAACTGPNNGVLDTQETGGSGGPTAGPDTPTGPGEASGGEDPTAGPDGPPAIGEWRECILGADARIDLARYESVARSYHTAEIVDCRLGPRYADFHDAPREAPTVYQPDPDGLWRGGLDPALAQAFCVTPDELPTNEQEEAALYDGGGGWIMSGQLLFSPDADAPGEFSAGCANARNFDAAMARKYDENNELETRGLCMRMRSEWYPDWWNRNGISVPTSTVIEKVLAAYPDTPLPPVATARGETQASVTGFLAFQNGLIVAAGTGNDSYTFGVGDVEPTLRLPPGKVPTAIAVTPTNEFVLVTVWDVNEHKGQLGVIAVGTDDPAVISLKAHGRHAWGVFNWPGVHALKLLGFVDLPMMAPSSLSVTNSSAPRSLRGHDEWTEQDLNQQAVRDEWFNRPWEEMSDQTKFLMLAHTGYAVVASRAENKVAFVDLRPLFRFYREMYLTTQEKWDQTADDNQGPGPNQWPYTFEGAPGQMPVVLEPVLEIQQPTSVLARKREAGTSNRAYEDDPNNPRAMYKTALVASMDGTVRIYDTESLGDPTLAPTAPNQPMMTMMVGPNPVQITAPISGDGYMDDLFVVSRGGSTVTSFKYDGTLIGVLDDARLQDPVWVAVGVNGAGYGGSGPNYAVQARVLTVLDHEGKQVVDYGMDIGKSPNDEQWNFIDGDGQPALFLHGFSNPLPGEPFMFTFDEVI